MAAEESEHPPGHVPVLDYYTPQPPSGLTAWLRRLPRPSWTTVMVVILSALAIVWLVRDHAAWVTVRQFDGSLLTPWTSPDGIVSADGKRLLAFLPGGKTIRVYDLQTGKGICDLKGATGLVRTMAFSPDGSRVWMCPFGNGGGLFWDIPSGQIVARVLPEDSSFGTTWAGMARVSPFSTDGRWFAAENGANLIVCDGHTASPVKKLSATAFLFFPIFSPDSRYLVAQSWRSGGIIAWDTQTWEQIAELPRERTARADYLLGPGANRRLAFSPDGRMLAAARNTQVDLLSPGTFQLIGTINTGPSHICQFSPDGRYLITIEGNKIQCWDISSRQLVGKATAGDSVTDLTISPDSSRLVDGYVIRELPSLAPRMELSVYSPICWINGQHAFVGLDRQSQGKIDLVKRRRPEAFYGYLWLPQFWLAFLGAITSAWLIRRDVHRWRRNPPVLP